MQANFADNLDEKRLTLLTGLALILGIAVTATTFVQDTQPDGYDLNVTTKALWISNPQKLLSEQMQQ